MALTQISTAGVKDDAVTAGKIPANAVGSSELADNAVDNAAVASNAAIAGSKIAPDFGSQNILTTGNTGIGETSPANLLHVKVSDTGITPHSSAQIVLERSGTNYLQFLTAANGTSGMLFGDANDIDVAKIVYDHNVPSMQFFTETSQAMTIDDNQRVGIGTTSPSAKLHVETGTTGTIAQFRGDSTDLLNIDGDSNQITLDTRNTAGLAFEMQGSEAMRIDSSGNVGIGTASPRTTLDLATGQLAFSHRTDYSIRFYNGQGNNWSSINNPRTADGTNNSELEFRTGTGRLRLDNSGKMGINIHNSDNLSPVRDLDIASSTGAILRLVSTNDSAGANDRVGEIEFYTNDDDAAHVSSFIKAIQDPSDSYGRRGSLTFGTRSDSGNGTEKIRILHSGGITFNGDTAAANALDDYEEGTYTPTDGSGAGLSLTNNTTARYTKIGRMVYVQFDITWPSTSSSATAGFSLPTGLQISYGTGVIGWTDRGYPLFIHVGGYAYVMDNNSSIGNSSQHSINSELSGKRLIGNLWYIG